MPELRIIVRIRNGIVESIYSDCSKLNISVIDEDEYNDNDYMEYREELEEETEILIEHHVGGY